jgi:hypothetical protein
MGLKTVYVDGVLEITNFSEGGGALIRVDRSGQCALYEVPQYGGEERFEGYYPNVCLALDASANWS